MAALLLWPQMRILWWLHGETDAPAAYVIPVAGVETWELQPTFGVRRSSTHVHEGIDIMAPAGTPVLAVTDGIIYDDRPNPVGGNVVWILGAGRRLYYFAHLREVEAGIRRGRVVRAGDRIGSVGNTGNAIRTPSHLHFEILQVTSDSLPLKYQEVDPYAQLVWRGRTRVPEAAETSSAPPRWESLPLEPSRGLEFSASGLEARAREAAARVEKTLGAVDPFLGVDADADARRVRHLQQLARRLGALGQALQAGSGSQSPTLVDAPSPTRELATRLFLATEQLDSILTAWADCGPRHLSVALAALEGISLGLATVEEAAAEGERPAALQYLFFEGHRPGVVPPQGGWLVVVGSRLAKQSASTVELRLLGGGRSVATWSAHPLGADAMAVWAAPEILAEHAGECLSLAVRRGRSPGPARNGDASDATLPLCIPQSASTAYELAARLEYRTPFRSQVLESKPLLLVNESCHRDAEVSELLEWDLDEASALVDLGDAVIFEANDPMVECALEGAGIRCAGILPPSICESNEDGDPRRVRLTEWEHAFAPTLRIPEEEEHVSQALSPLIDTETESPMCIELVREAASEVSHMRFQLIAANAHQRRVFFESPVETLSAQRKVSYDLSSHRIEADLQVGDATHPARVCVVLHAEACAF